MKKLYIMCAIPGAGKGWWISQNLPNAYVGSADHFFIKNGVYTFNGGLIGKAHEFCHENIKTAMALDTAEVVVDNTNLATWQMKGYLEFAEKYGYDVEIIRISVDPTVAFERQTHGVPKEGHDRMVAQFNKRDLPEGIKVREVSN